jgi:hypothetical protein
MGVRMTTEDADNTSSGAFSEDILKIEISGPKASEVPEKIIHLLTC